MRVLLRPICWLVGHDEGAVGGYYEGYMCERCNKWGLNAQSEDVSDDQH